MGWMRYLDHSGKPYMGIGSQDLVTDIPESAAAILPKVQEAVEAARRRG